MRTRPNPLAVTRDQELAFRARVEAWSRRAAVVTPHVTIQRQHALCVVRGAVAALHLDVDPKVLTAPVPVQDWVLAHEFAHALLGHTHGKMRRLRAAQIVAVLALLALLGVVGALLIGSALLFPGLAVVLILSITLAVLLSPVRRREFAADKVAAERFGQPFNRHVAKWLKSAGSRDPGVPWDLLTTHPSHRRRIRASKYPQG